MFRLPRVTAPILWVGVAAMPAFGQVAVEIPFAAELAGIPFGCGTTASMGVSGRPVRGADLRLHVADVALTDASGRTVPVTLDDDGIWQSGGAALLDFENGADPCVDGSPGTNLSLRGTVPAGGWHMPFALDHADAPLAASPLNVSAMFWSWQAGYKSLKIDFVPEAAGTAMPGGDLGPNPAPALMAFMGAGLGAGGYFLHVGAFDCGEAVRSRTPATECGRPNRTAVSLEGFDPAAGTVVIDPAPVLAGADPMTNAPGTAPGCKSSPLDADCAGVMPEEVIAHHAAGNRMITPGPVSGPATTARSRTRV